MKMGLGVKMGASLSLTPQLQQAIRLLQLSSLELAQEINLQLETNPLLELETTAEELDAASTDDYELDGSERELDELMANDNLSDDMSVDAEWDDVYTHEPTKWDKAAASDFEVSGQTTDSIQSHVRWQLNLMRLSPIDTYIADQLLDSMDNHGYVEINLAELAQNISTELTFLGLNNADIDPDVCEADVAVVLKLVQSCEPTGVGARNLAECLRLQLHAIAGDTPESDTSKVNASEIAAAFAILKYHELLEKNDIKGLLKATELSLDELKSAMCLLRTLDPYPGLEFAAQDEEYQTPDVLVDVKGGAYRVRLNPETVTRLGINDTYAQFIKRGDTSEEQTYLKNHLSEAKHFIKGVEERNKSLLKVATAICEAQVAFFEQGEVAMKPLILRDIADKVDLHESTVSRITTAKYMLTPQGLFELKYFFSSHVSTDMGGECSSTAICAMIKTFIDGESPKKPLSDSKLTGLLQDKGIEVARRTVAKYREQMGIGSSTERKRLI